MKGTLITLMVIMAASAAPAAVWVGGESSTPSNDNRVDARVYEKDYDNDGADTWMRFYFKIGSSGVGVANEFANGTWSYQSGNDDYYYSNIPAPDGTTVYWKAYGHSSTGEEAWGSGGEQSFTADGAFKTGYHDWDGDVENRSSKYVQRGDTDNVTADTNIYDDVQAYIYLGIKDGWLGGGGSATLYYTTNGAKPTTLSTPNAFGFIEKNGSTGDEDYEKWRTDIGPFTAGTTVKYIIKTTASGGDVAYIARNGGSYERWSNDGYWKDSNFIFADYTPFEFVVQDDDTTGPVINMGTPDTEMSHNAGLVVTATINDAISQADESTAVLKYGYDAPWDAVTVTRDSGIDNGTYQWTIPAQGASKIGQTLKFFVQCSDDDNDGGSDASQTIADNSGAFYPVTIVSGAARGAIILID